VLACLGLEAHDLSFLFGVAADRRQVVDAARADHKFLIVPQCTLSAGIGLCGICDKGEQLLAILLVFRALPQLRHKRAVRPHSLWPMMGRTEMARSATNT
jgi:hypothetical protein